VELGNSNLTQQPANWKSGFNICSRIIHTKMQRRKDAKKVKNTKSYFAFKSLRLCHFS
jgi:hypothetical protein